MSKPEIENSQPQEEGMIPAQEPQLQEEGVSQIQYAQTEQSITISPFQIYERNQAKLKAKVAAEQILSATANDALEALKAGDIQKAIELLNTKEQIVTGSSPSYTMSALNVFINPTIFGDAVEDEGKLLQERYEFLAKIIRHKSTIDLTDIYIVL